MKLSWKIQDLIDLEYFFHQDRYVNENLLDQRDRKIFMGETALDKGMGKKDAAHDHRRLIRQWLDVRRREEKRDNPQLLLPGEAFGNVFQVLTMILTAAGGMMGVVLAAAFLRYSGSEPINVFYYLGLLVFTQVLLALFMVGVLITGMARPFHLSVSPLYGWMGRILARGMEKIARPMEDRVTGARKQQLQWIGDFIRLKNKIYGKLFYWPVFILFQIFGVALNVGILLGTLIRILFTDLAFGWQTTLQLAPLAVFKLAGVLSLPWQWAVPSAMAHPTLEEIEGSRIILKEGIQTLATQDLVSWWPFLCFSIIAYGAIPRMLFLIYGILSRSRLLKRLPLTHGDCQKLMARMTTPLVESFGTGSEKDVLPDPNNQGRTTHTGGVETAVKDKASAVVLIPEDIQEGVSQKQLGDHFGKYLDSERMICGNITMDMDADAKTIRPLLETAADSRNRLFVLLEAWQPPIKETLTYLKTLRSKIGEETIMVVGLVGKPHGTDIFSRVEDGDFAVWENKAANLRDPYLVLTRCSP